MQDEDALREVAKDCVHCGFCLPACPTYQLWGQEMDSPRGRIYLVNEILDGASLSATAAEHFDRCLGCMACMTACPSGVQYDQLIEAARVWTEEARSGPEVRLPVSEGTAPAGKRPVRDRVARAAIFSLFPYPGRLRALTAPLRTAQRTGLDRRLARSTLPGRASPALGAALRLAPPAVTWGKLPERVPARGPRRAVVGMLTGCVQSVFFPQVNASTARVLAAEGCDVIIPRGQGCCGALSLHSGREAEAAAFARRTIAIFEQGGVDAIVVNSAGCGSAMKEYDRLLAGGEGQDGAGWAERAAEMSGKVSDRAGGPAAPAAGHRCLPRRLPPGARPRDHPAAPRAAPRDPRPDPGRAARRGHLLRFGGGLQLAPARGGQRAGRAQGGSGHRRGRAAAHLRQPRLLAADRVGPGRTRRARRGRAHRRDPRRLHPRPAADLVCLGQ